MRKFIYLLFLICVSCTNPLGDEDVLDTSSKAPPEAFDFLMLQNVDQSLLVSWTVSKGAKSYELSYGTATGTYTETMTVAQSPAVINGLSAGNIYYFRAKAINPLGSTLSSSEKSFTHMGPPGAFSMLTATPAPGAVSLTWAASAQATSYIVKRGTAPGAISIVVSSNATSPFNVTGLTNNTTYYFSVTAKNAMAEVLASNTLSATPAALPSAPTNGSVVRAVDSCALSWDPPNTTTPGPFTYQVRRVVGSITNNICSDISTRTCTETGLALGTHTYRVFTTAPSGTSSTYLTITCNLSALAQPSISSVNPLYQSARVNWTTATNVDSYSVYYGTDSPPTTLASDTATPGYVITGLTNGTSYNVMLVAKNYSGERSSNISTVTPVSAPPTITLTDTKPAVSLGISSSKTFTINDNDAGDILTCTGSVTAASGNELYLRDSDIQLSGTAPNCTVTMSPMVGVYGQAQVTLSVTDGPNTTNTTFNFHSLPAPQRIYSLKKYGSFNGTAITLRRTDGTTSSFTFSASGVLNKASIDSFLGGQTAYVTNWYDQGSGGQHASQSVDAYQPQLVYSSGEYRIQGDGVDDYLVIPSLNSISTISIYSIINAASSVLNNPLLSYGSMDAGTYDGFHLIKNDQVRWFAHSSPDNSSWEVTEGPSAPENTKSTVSLVLNTSSNKKDILINGSRTAGSISGFQNPANGTPAYLFMGGETSSPNYFHGTTTELLFFNVELTTPQIQTLDLR